MRSYFSRRKAKTMYMPLNEGPSCLPQENSRGVVGMFGKSTRSWLSRSAPSTPCDGFPNFPPYKKGGSGSQKGSKGQICDDKPLLDEPDEQCS